MKAKGFFWCLSQKCTILGRFVGKKRAARRQLKLSRKLLNLRVGKNTSGRRSWRLQVQANLAVAFFGFRLLARKDHKYVVFQLLCDTLILSTKWRLGDETQ